MERVLTGIQPSGSITLGNYLGAIEQMVASQGACESYVFIADLHAITVSQDPLTLRSNIRSLLALYLACGLDPEQNTIYLQSDIEHIPCISWILECHTYYGELSRMTQFKDKSCKNSNFTSGLLTYPVLMAADILALDADVVPIGGDQKQHVELARNIAERFNNRYGEHFTIPKPRIKADVTKITDLQAPDKKMSKSSDNTKGVIFMLDDLDATRKKIMSAVTDSGDKVKYDIVNKAGISNLMTIYHALTGKSMVQIEEIFDGANYGSFKRAVADEVVTRLADIQRRYAELLQSGQLDQVLDEGADKVRIMVQKKYTALRQVVGVSR